VYFLVLLYKFKYSFNVWIWNILNVGKFMKFPAFFEHSSIYSRLQQ